MEKEVRAIRESETMDSTAEKVDLSGKYTEVKLADATSAYKVFTAVRCEKNIVLKTPNGDSGLLLQLLQREYEIAVRLSHPNIVAVYGWENETPVGPSMVMEQIDGVDLAEWLEEKPSRKERERVMSQILDAVEYLHECGVIHNDLKPANIMITDTCGVVKIIDFGMADRETRTVQTAVAKDCNAPELAEERPKDIRTDIYSLGVILRLLTGHRYELVVRKCTDPFAEKRYANVAEMRRSLRIHRMVPRVVAITILLILAVIGIIVGVNDYTKSVRYDDAAAVDTPAEQAGKEIEALRDSLAVVKEQRKQEADSIARLNEILTMIGNREQRLDSLRKEFVSGAEELSNKIVKRIRSCKDVTSGFNELNRWQTEYPEYCRTFSRNNNEEGEEVLRRYSSTENDRLYLKLVEETKKLPTAPIPAPPTSAATPPPAPTPTTTGPLPSTVE